MTEPRQAQLPLLLSISEGLSRGTDEMLRVSPQGDAIHPPSCSLAIREAVEEIEWLRAKNKSLFEEVERIDDLFLSREKTLFTQRREIERLRAEVERLTRQRDEARAEVERLRKEMLEVAEELENEEPRSHKNIAFGIRNALEAKP